MKVVLVQPDTDKIYKDRQLAYGSPMRPPETGLAVLDGWVRAYSKRQPEVKILNPYAEFEEIVEEGAKGDCFGMTSLYTNHQNCDRIATAVKKRNSEVKIILGGHNAAMLGELALLQNPNVDYVVGSPITRDGEDALRGLVDGIPEPEIPNLWYRNQQGVIKFTYPSFTNLEMIPLWNFQNFQDLDERLQEYLQNQEADPWQVCPVALFSSRDCLKAKKEGPCSYCTSCEKGRFRTLSVDKFWAQERHLNQLYSARVFYISDEIFLFSLRRAEQLFNTKPPQTKALIRGYGYLRYLAVLGDQKLRKMARFLEGWMFNVFYGVETYAAEILDKANKKGVSVEETVQVTRLLYEEGNIKYTAAFLAGLPGTSKETLKVDLDALKTLAKETGEAFERLYFSIAIPLRGSPLFNQLLSSHDVTNDYYRQTKKSLANDSYPDYKLLVRLMWKYFTTVSPQVLRDYMQLMIDEASAYIPRHRIGGFMLDL